MRNAPAHNRHRHRNCSPSNHNPFSNPNLSRNPNLYCIYINRTPDPNSVYPATREKRHLHRNALTVTSHLGCRGRVKIHTP